MGQPLQIAVIADDLTGGADTGVQYCPVVGPVYLTGMVDGAIDFSGIDARGLSLYTNSRHLEAAVAGDTIRLAAAQIQKFAPERIYKKIDSCLRGNLGAELDALLEMTSARMSFVAPAFPKQGRTTENDIHKINGIPVAETEIGRDPLCPVLESRLSLLLSAQSRFAVGHVDLDSINKGAPAMAQKVRELIDQECRHIVFDTTKESHLDAIITLANGQFENEKILFAGSAGLAGSLVRSMDSMVQEVDRLLTTERPRIEKWLFVCGSASKIMAEQASNLEKQSDWPHMKIDPSLLVEGVTNAGYRSAARRAVAIWTDSSLILSIKSIQKDISTDENPDKLIAEMATVVELLLSKFPPQGLFLSGGDTAERVLRRIGAMGLYLHEEILPGLMLGKIAGGSFNGLPVVTKAGAFGDPNTLYKLINRLK